MTKSTTRMVRIALFTALICVGAFISVPIGPVPISFQNFFVIMAALLLPAKDAALSVLIYVLIGLAGLPVFAQFTGGIQTIFKPSFGFLIGFIIGAYVIAKFVGDSRDYKKIFLATIIGEIIFYLIGIPYMYYILAGMSKAPGTITALLQLGLIPFIPGDLLKMVVATAIAPKIKNAIQYK
ncbi:biotin transport system substrate-specific component [Peptoniphilus asaccharolyticus DSM 20463]|uniref:Biotin transporter n=1 Tax=Peptoniphilus asaccharolyticus DSM 20463 TaxID=573058 RepID=A0A1W1VB01_PEPAS|nr:biotin transporter BioY [Peptoniphilus asaccharolyticus]MBL7575749.1 biotin transporter BioY [Peptoniphilus asaccharolyticus]SMB90154.1 biotin transport system substrate-specific component [Peptoniphilus asaccharolyticus DSM 20463]